jgi:two-component system, NtrC family, sensor histidine kinase HydH
MSRRIFFRITAWSFAIGLLFLAACLLSIRYIHRLQENLTEILADNVSSLQAAQELEIRVRQLRFHSILYQLDPRPDRLEKITDDEDRFEQALEVARQNSHEPDEQAALQKIEKGYEQYKREQEQLRLQGRGKGPLDISKMADEHPVQFVVVPCQELLQLNKDKMIETAEESERVSRNGYLAMIFLGLAGPVGGLVMGYGIRYGLRRSIYRLSVRVQDIAHHLDRKVGSVSVVADGDLNHLEQQMKFVVQRVEQAAQQLQKQQRELFRAEQLSLVGQLAAGVAHEVRNPLTGIKMLVEAAIRPQAPQALATEDLQVIHREIMRLEHIVQSFLSFARLPSPQFAPTDLRELIQQSWGLVHARARQQQVELDLDAPNEPVVATVDPAQISTVLVNLFLNAMDASPSGSRLEVALRRNAEKDIILTVCDQGSGIALETQRRLFEPFHTSKPLGTGLGLSLSRRILEEHGGSISGRTRPQGGACFTIVLPALRQVIHENAADR